MALETDRKIPDAGLRASDAERRDCINALSAHFVEGRLDQAELDERIGAAMAAKTRGELAALLKDLPRSLQPSETPGGLRRRARHPLLVVAGILFVVAALSAITHQGPGPAFGQTMQFSHSALPVLLVVAAVCAAVCWQRSARRVHR